jgi:hypothetical protein
VIIPSALPRLFQLILFWALPLVIPAVCAIRFLMDTPAAPVAAGWSWLALPIELALAENPLQGWPIYSLEEQPVAPLLGAAAPLEIAYASPAAASLPIEVHGHVGQGSTAVYCFFDTNTNKWFRMSPGDVDAVRRLALRTDPDEGIPHLVELSSGKRYRIRPGKRKPLPVTE